VIVTEIDPIKALEAKMDGFEVMPLLDAISQADIAISVTGNKHVIDEAHIKKAKDGVILAQAGHFDVEINKIALKKLATSVSRIRPMVDQYSIGKKQIYLLGEGRLVNLAAADGHPASVMDTSFAGQALAAEHIWKKRQQLEHKVYALPSAIDTEIARLKLKSRGIQIDRLTNEQAIYLNSWQEGT